ncbi:N5-carboxyaminoimidazole ribonucleotide synthase [anaerobic digester metagenome]|jgi:pyrrolysine biosynthesis protein PylC
MMRIGIIGGALQGMEATYLSTKAGYETLVLDRRKDAPALSLADETLVVDVEKDRGSALKALADCDVLLPANEEIGALRTITEMAKRAGVPLLFDLDAYTVSESKIRSNELLQRLGVPIPRKWPSCGFPVVVKPSTGSGSCGVAKASSEEEMSRMVRRLREEGSQPVVEEYVNGPNISIEVVGNGENFTPYVITEIVLDDNYDCKRVYSPYRSSDPVHEEFTKCAVETARALKIKGIMDMEAIVVDGKPRVLEIDARIPSQTPAAILHSHEINLVKEMVEAMNGRPRKSFVSQKARASVYEHVRIDGGVMRSCGEGAFAGVHSPRIIRGIFGADEMITDYRPGTKTWVATIMISADDRGSLLKRRVDCLNRIMEENSITEHLDPFPEGYDDSVDR